MTHIDLRYWAKHRKVVYYPEFGYILPDYWDKIHSPIHSISEVSRHLFQIKCLLLFFDFVLVPLEHLLEPYTGIAHQTFKKILLHRDFNELVEKGLIITSIWGGRDVLESAETHEVFLNSITWPSVPKYSKSELRAFSKVMVWPRIVLNQSEWLKKKTLELLDANRLILTGHRRLKDIIKRATFKEEIPFVHQTFFHCLARDHREQDRFLLKLLNGVYFGSGEIGNPGTVIYSSPKLQVDYLDRKCIDTGVFSFLYSPEFFLRILGHFLTKDIIPIIGTISPSEIVNLRSFWFWREGVDCYHSTLCMASKALDNTGPQYREGRAISETINRMQFRIYNEPGFTVLTDLALLIITNLAKVTVPKDSIFMQKLSRRLDLASLRHVNTALHALFVGIKRVLSSCLKKSRL